MSKSMPASREPFWLSKSLTEMTEEEWELLCDGCGRCCLQKLEYKDTGEVFYTNVACRFLDPYRCRCTSYEQRANLVENCLVMTPAKATELQWLPNSCAYRRLALGQELEWWHPLLSGDPNTVHDAGISVRDKVVSEQSVRPEKMEDHIVHWWNGGLNQLKPKDLES